MADRYWTYPRGVSASFHNTAYWSATQGGSGGASVPTTGDIAHFNGTAYNGTSGACEVDQAVLCAIDTVGQYDNTDFTITTGGSVSLEADLTGFANFYLSGGSLTTGNFTISAYKSIRLQSGTADVGSSNLILTDDLYSGSTNAFSVSEGCDVDLSEASIICNGLASFSCGGKEFGNVEINLPGGEIHGNGTFNVLSILGDGSLEFRNDLGDQTLTITGELIIEGNTTGGLTLSVRETDYDIIFNQTSGIVTAENCTIGNSVAEGGATFLALSSYGCVDDGGNTGWVTLARFYVTHEDYNFHDIDNWSETSGGTGGASVPTTGYTAIFDANSPALVDITDEVLCSITVTQDPMQFSVKTGGILNLYNDLTIYYISVSETGSFVTNNHNITINALDFLDTPSVSLGTSIITFVPIGSYQGFYASPGVTVDADEATIIIYADAAGSYLESYGNTFGTVNLVLTGNNQFIDVWGSNTFGDLSITGDGTIFFNADEDVPTTQTITGTLTLEGDTEEGLVLDEYLYDYWEISMASGTVNASNCFFYRSVATGGATFNALYEDGNNNGGGNTGWDFGEISLDVTINEGLTLAGTQDVLLTIQADADDNIDLGELYSLSWASGSNSIYDEEMYDGVLISGSLLPLWTYPSPISDAIEFIDSHGIGWLETVTDAAALADLLYFVFDKTVSEILFIYDTIIHGWRVTSDESLVLTDSLSEVMGLLISDWLTLLDSQSNNWNGVDTISDTLNLYDISQKGLYYADTLSDAVNLEDVATRALTITILDVLGFTELANAVRSGGISVSDSVSMLDTSDSALSLIISEALSVIDAESLAVILAGYIADGMAITDEGSLSRRVLTTNTEALTFVDTASSKGTLYSLVYDTLKMNVIIELGSEVYECYVLNTPNFMPSMYSGFDFNSYCVFENRAFGANAKGIYELAGSTDAGATIHTGVIMNETDFGAANQKRFRRGYLGISGTRPVMIMETEGGERKAYTIDTNGKMVASHDLKSKKWTLSVADFDTLDAIKLIPVILTR